MFGWCRGGVNANGISDGCQKNAAMKKKVISTSHFVLDVTGRLW